MITVDITFVLEVKQESGSNAARKNYFSIISVTGKNYADIIRQSKAWIRGFNKDHKIMKIRRANENEFLEFLK